MATYYVDDGGNNSDGSSWANAYYSFYDLTAAHNPLASGDIVYVGADSNDPNTYSTYYTLYGPTSNPPAKIISVTQGTTTYAKGTGTQIDTTNGAYRVNIDGAFEIYGLLIKSGSDVRFYQDADETLISYDMTLLPAHGSAARLNYTNGGLAYFNDLTIDLAQDYTGSSAYVISASYDSVVRINGLTISNASYRTDEIIPIPGGIRQFSNADLSGFGSGVNFIDSIGQLPLTAENIKTPVTESITDIQSTYFSFRQEITDPGNSAGDGIKIVDNFASLTSTSSIYRTGGAEVESSGHSWGVVTTANCAEGAPFHTPYIYGTVSSTGSHTFDVYITNDSADLTDAEVWLEVEVQGASAPAMTVARDKRTITDSAAAQTDDTGSTWNGSGPSFTYKQKLSVTTTVSTAGKFRARVFVAKASLAASAYLYIDPLVTVS